MIFNSHDGDGTEVRVETMHGLVTNINENDKTVHVDLKSLLPALKRPVGGYIMKDDPIYDIVKKAYETKEEIDFRIEVQRKANQDRSIPIDTLRADNPTETLVRKLVAVNDTFSQEALTNPADDPKGNRGKARSALHMSHNQANAPQVTAQSAVANIEHIVQTLADAIKENLPQPVIANLQGQALLAGLSWEEILNIGITPETEPAPHRLRSAYAVEAPSFKEYNSDGRYNVGNYAVASYCGVYSYLLNYGDKNHLSLSPATIDYYAELLLSIADRVQTIGIGEGSVPNRMSSSHTRARSILFALIESNSKYQLPLPQGGSELPDHDSVYAWVQALGKEASRVFLNARRLSQEIRPMSAILKDLEPRTRQEPTKPTTDTVAPVNNEEPHDLTAEELAHARNLVSQSVGTAKHVVPKPKTAPVRREETTSTQPHQAKPVSPSQGAQQGSDEPADSGLYPQKLLPSGAMTQENAPSDEILEEFKTFVNKDAKVRKEDLHKVTDLLKWTFGKVYGKASNIPEDELIDFLDFYTSAGADNFLRVINNIPKA
jgi:hypothetical protein